VFTVSKKLLQRVGLLAIGIAAGAALTGSPVVASLRQPTTTPVAWVAPEGVVQITPCVPLMGEHWANPADLPMGPIFTVYEGRLMSIEYMPTQADLMDGKSWNDLTFRYLGQQLPIDHVDVDFQPRGHEGLEVPHYDMHFFLVRHVEDREITCQ
jgi:hypothetical protein